MSVREGWCVYVCWGVERYWHTTIFYRPKTDIIVSGHTVLLQVAGHFVNALNALNSRHWASGGKKESQKHSQTLKQPLKACQNTHPRCQT